MTERGLEIAVANSSPEATLTPLQRIRMAQDFFRFAHHVGTPISFGRRVEVPPPGLLIWGRHSLSPDEIELDKETFAFCGTILERLAYRLLAMELDAALILAFRGEDRFNHMDAFIRNASTVIRLIRNAVAHNVLDPVWKIDRNLRNKQITIEGLLTFDTRDLHGKPLKRLDFGGPIALFRLSERIVAELERIKAPVVAEA